MFSTQQYSGFDPRTIPGCALWLDAADSNAFTFSSGSNISTWKDKSQSGLTGTAVNSPVLTANAINGLPAVVFDGATQYFSLGNTLNLENTSNMLCIFSVVRYTTTTAAGSIITKVGPSASGRWALYRLSGGSMFYFVQGDASQGTTSYNDSTSTAQITSGIWDRSNISLLQNGTQKSSSAFSGTTTTTNTYTTLIGAYYTGSAFTTYFSGNIAEIIVFLSPSFTTSQRQQLEGYLAWKWGLNTNLPTGHPFKPNPTAMRVFQPIDISGCNLWLDAMDKTTFTPANPSDGTGITAWSDKSGSNFTFSRTYGTTNATYNAASNSLFFSTSNAGYSSSHPASVNNETLFTVFTSTFNGSAYIIGATGSGGREVGTYVNWTRFGSINAATEWAAITPNGSMTGGARNLGVSTVSASSNLAVAVNGGTFTTYTLANPLGSNARTSTLGVEGTTPTYSGHIHEVITYNRVLSTSERQQVEGYLATKWGTSSLLPTTQPYYLSRVLPSTPLFTPTALSGTVLWLDAADLTTMFQNTAGTTAVTSFGQTVNNWKDKSGSGLNAVATGTGATYQLNAGYPSLTFNGNPMNTATIPSAYLDSTGVTFFAVSTKTGTNTTHVVLGTHVPEKVIRYDPFTCIYSINNGTVRGGNNNTDGIRCFIDTASSFNAFVNGTNVITSSTAVTYQPQTTSTTYQIGNLAAGQSLFQGYINEILVFNNALTTSQRQQVEGYLAWKWGLQNNLPTTHPYYKFRP